MRRTLGMLGGAFVVAVAPSVLAVPTLQLTIEGGDYANCVSVDNQTTCATSDPFNLVALLNPEGVGNPTTYPIPDPNTFRISAALIPKVAEETPAPDLGSITFDGFTVAVAGDMTFGTPPVETEDLQTHGIFETYYWEYDFGFNSDSTTGVFNAQDDAPINAVTDTNCAPEKEVCGYFRSFEVSIGSLPEGYGIHFDLYQVDSSRNVIDFAPFSKDAQSGSSGGGSNGGGGSSGGSIPEPGSPLALMALGGFIILLTARGRFLRR